MASERRVHDILGAEACTKPDMPDSRMKNGDIVGRKLILEDELFPRILKALLSSATEGTLLEGIDSDVAPNIMVDMRAFQKATKSVGARIDFERKQKRERIVQSRRLIGRKRLRNEEAVQEPMQEENLITSILSGSDSEEEDSYYRPSNSTAAQQHSTRYMSRSPLRSAYRSRSPRPRYRSRSPLWSRSRSRSPPYSRNRSRTPPRFNSKPVPRPRDRSPPAKARKIQGHGRTAASMPVNLSRRPHFNRSRQQQTQRRPDYQHNRNQRQ